MAKKKTKKRQAVSKKFIPQTNIFADEIYLPNHSGEHTAGTTTTPINGNHIANKDYVDAQIAGENHWDDDGTNLKPFIAGRNVLTTGNVQGVTQAEFNTLTDNSIANALHRHSELVASDGTPDPALSVDASGNVGIGTTSPGAKLDIIGTSFPVLQITRNRAVTLGGIYGASILEMKKTTGTTIDGDGIGFFFKSQNDAGESIHAGMFGGALADVSNGNEKGEVVFGASYHGADPYLQRHLVITATGANTGDVLVPNGNVGIGTTSPNSKLEVDGAISSAVLAVTSANDGTIAVGGINHIFIDASTAAVVINDFTGGVAGQVMHLVIKTPDASNTVTITDTSGSNQELYNHSEANYVFAVNERGGFIFICDGTNWYDVSHAKHV